MNVPEFKPKVVCVDDDVLMTQLMAETLAPSNFEILVAHCVNEAFELVVEHENDLVMVVCDYSLGEKTGFDLRAKMLENHHEIPFLLVSGNVSREVAMNAVEMKIAGFIAKPFNHKLLLESVLKESSNRLQSLRDDLELLTGFIQEAQALTDEIEAHLLSLDENPSDIDVINRIFACAHTIKGTSSFFKPNYVHSFTHKYEDYLSQFKRNPERLNRDAIGVLLRALDTIKELVTCLASRSRLVFDIETLSKVFTEIPTESMSEAPSDLATSNGAGKSATHTQVDELRVSLTVLNGFMEKSGELTVLRNMINKVVKVIETSHPDDPQVSVLTELLSEMHKVNGSMQDQVTDLRKVSLKQVFKPLARVVRDLSSTLAKKIEWQTRGDELRVDHTLAEVLNKCLIHLIRNSADHGLEDGATRAANGKPPQGFIRVTAKEAADRIVISVSDDGRGIDPVKIKTIALKKGLITSDEAARMTDQKAQMLIFAPGFSTADVITDVSGRGVGTDMVRGTIESLGGSIVIDSEVGRGTEFVLSLPLPKSVLIKNSLFFKSGGETFGLDRDQIIRVSDLRDQPTAARLRRIGNERLLESELGLLPVIELSKVLRIEAQSAAEMFLVVQSKRGAFCLCVEEVLDIEDAVIKKVGRWTGPLPVYEGASFLGDGRVGLILSADGLSDAIGLKERIYGEETLRTISLGSKPKESILLFKLGELGTYAVNQIEIVRVEELSRSKIQLSGGQPVAIHSGLAMPLIDLAQRLEARASSAFERDLIKVIVVESIGRFYGFIVDEIQDFVECETLSEDENVFSNGVGCARIIENRAVTLVSLKCLADSEKAAAQTRDAS